MSADFVFNMPAKGRRLLRVIVAEIKSGRIQRRRPETFLSYSEALRALKIAPQRHAGGQLQREGLSALNEWVKSHELPKITGLIIDKQKRTPGRGFFAAFGRKTTDLEWWLDETDKAIDFDWSRFFQDIPREKHSAIIKEVPQEPQNGDYRGIITIEPGKRGGRPCIRGMRIAVSDVLGWLAAGMTEKEIIDDFPELTHFDIHAALAFAADREKRARRIGHEIAL